MGRPSTAGSASQNRIMGKVKSSPFAGDSITEPRAKPASMFPIYIAIAAIAALGIMLVRQRSNPAVQTGPLVTLTPVVADQSAIDNLTASILAVSGQTPTGGVSTPITTTGA